MKLLSQNIVKCAVICFCSGMVFSGTACADSSGFLQGSVYEKVGKETGIDPGLLYSVSLLESAARSGRESGVSYIAPSPYAIRGPGGSVYPATYDDAVNELKRQISRYGKRRLDIGLMQINGQHWSRVDRPEELLNPYTNVKIGAELLQDALDREKDDLELAIGHYHSPTEWRARSYGSRVLAVYDNIMEIR